MKSARLLLVAAIAMSGWHALAQATLSPVNDRPNPYQTIANYFKLPAGRTWGSTSAVDIDKDGRSIWVVKLGAQDERNLEVLWVEVAGEQPKVTTGQPVQIRGLVYAPWVGRDNKIRRSFRADGIEPVNGSKAGPHAA